MPMDIEFRQLLASHLHFLSLLICPICEVVSEMNLIEYFVVFCISFPTLFVPSARLFSTQFSFLVFIFCLFFVLFFIYIFPPSLSVPSVRQFLSQFLFCILYFLLFFWIFVFVSSPIFSVFGFAFSLPACLSHLWGRRKVGWTDFGKDLSFRQLMLSIPQSSGWVWIDFLFAISVFFNFFQIMLVGLLMIL